ncbi:hypothetical protein [Paenibacillus senegalimassiliensis]|uniref:hypothetical protein n=1 Tax=Paenibacillus senegalimassiliensis TaxID=1737426 RepID=UPI00073E2F35|nr:hypothetical protein [Paenibacillus senegalimassiliensis]
MFRNWFKKKQRGSSIPSSQTTSYEEKWLELKQTWEKARNEQSLSKQLLIQQESEAFERVRGMLEEALSLLDDACVETDGMLKVRLQQIWGDLDELVKSYTLE